MVVYLMLACARTYHEVTATPRGILERALTAAHRTMPLGPMLCVLFIADAGEIQTFCECNGARFRFNPDLARLVETFTRIFDHNLALLKAYEGESPLRSIERKGLEAWREFLLNRYDPEGIFRS